MPRKKKQDRDEGVEGAVKAVKAARKAYGLGVEETEKVKELREREERGEKRVFRALPHPREGTRLKTPKEWVDELGEDHLVAWAEHFVATGRNWGYFQASGSGWTRENLGWRTATSRLVAEHPVAQEVVIRLRQECVMSTLERRRKLKAISEAPEHPMKGLADNLKAIELDAKEDPEFVGNAKLVGGGVEGVTNVLNMFCLPDDAIVAVKAAKALADGGGRKVIEADFSVAEGVGVKVEPEA